MLVNVKKRRGRELLVHVANGNVPLSSVVKSCISLAERDLSGIMVVMERYALGCGCRIGCLQCTLVADVCTAGSSI